MLDYSRIESGKLSLEQQPLSLLGCIESAVHMCSDTAAKKGLELVYVVDPRVPAVILGDSTHLQQILLNLVSNGE